MSETKFTQEQLAKHYENYIPPTDQMIVKDEETGEYVKKSIRLVLRPELENSEE